MDSDLIIAELQKNFQKTDDRLLRMFNALGDQTRFRIFYSLCAGNDICVTELARIMTISVPAASQQLKLLELVGLVNRQRNGQKICYEINYDDVVVKDVIALINKHTV